MTDKLITLFCLIEGESTSNAFPVEIESAKTIGDLKKLIKNEKSPRFDAVVADELTLWRVSIAVVEDDGNDEIPILLDNVANTDKKKVSPVARLSKVFPEALVEETIHIIVQPSPTRHSDDLHPEVAVLRKQLSELEQLNVDMRITSISLPIVNRRGGKNIRICQYAADTKTSTLEELREHLRPHFEEFEGDDNLQIYLFQPGCAKPVWLADDNALRRCLEIAKDKHYKSLAVSLDRPSKSLSSYTWKDAQNQYGVQEYDLMPVFDIQPKSLLDKEKTVLKHIIQDCIYKNKAYVLNPASSEATKSSFVDSFMVGAMQFYASDMFLAQQREMSGMRGHGFVDFAVIDRVHQVQVLGVTEVKKEMSSEQGLAQNMDELDVAVQQKKRKRMEELDEDSGERPPIRFKSFGIVTDSFRWKLVECTLDEKDALTFRTKDIPGILDLKQDEENVKKDCEKVFSYVLPLFEMMKDEIVNRSTYGSPTSDSPNANKRIATGVARS